MEEVISREGWRETPYPFGLERLLGHRVPYKATCVRDTEVTEPILRIVDSTLSFPARGNSRQSCVKFSVENFEDAMAI